MKRSILVAMVVLLGLELGACAPTGKKVTTYPDGRIVKEDVNVGKYSIYGQAVADLVDKIEQSRRDSIQALERMAEPREGESTDLVAYKQGQSNAMIFAISSADPHESIAALYYGRDEYDVQDKAITVGGETVKFGLGVGAIWKTMDTALEQAGDVRVGDGSTYNPVELHGTGEGNIVTLDQSSEVVFEPSEIITEGEFFE